jgi:hypothetical protein
VTPPTRAWASNLRDQATLTILLIMGAGIGVSFAFT